MSDRQVKSTAKKLRALARAMQREADRCQTAADLCVTDMKAVHAKNAATWRGRARTCWSAVALLSVSPAAEER